MTAELVRETPFGPRSATGVGAADLIRTSGGLGRPLEGRPEARNRAFFGCRGRGVLQEVPKDATAKNAVDEAKAPFWTAFLGARNGKMGMEFLLVWRRPRQGRF